MTQFEPHVIILCRLVGLIVIKTGLLDPSELALLRYLPKTDNGFSIAVLRFPLIVNEHIVIMDLHELDL